MTTIIFLICITYEDIKYDKMKERLPSSSFFYISEIFLIFICNQYTILSNFKICKSFNITMAILLTINECKICCTCWLLLLIAGILNFFAFDIAYKFNCSDFKRQFYCQIYILYIYIIHFANYPRKIILYIY